MFHVIWLGQRLVLDPDILLDSPVTRIVSRDNVSLVVTYQVFEGENFDFSIIIGDENSMENSMISIWN